MTRLGGDLVVMSLKRDEVVERARAVLYLAAYLPLLINDVGPDSWRSARYGAPGVAGGTFFRLAALVALGAMAFSRRKSRDLA